MPLGNANIIKTHAFNHNGLGYVVTAFTEPSNPDQIKIDVTHNKLPVVITYPDGFKATLVYCVDLETRFDMAKTMGLNAVDELMRTAEEDIRRLI